ncbi:MAG: ribonuclease HII [Spirochaetes bacterium]|jgi:ribonuclease HII|nr:ribonuclease HII [Spirochaetota bacterium]
MICGIDEAGRGPLAGPVVAAAVTLPEDFPVERLSDSKQIREAERTELAALIRAEATRWGISCAWHDEIDSLNIHHATLLAMKRAFAAMLGVVAPGTEITADIGTDIDREGLTESGGVLDAGAFTVPGGRVLVDGRFTPELAWPAEAVVGGDRSVAQIQAASILAKTSRDRWMISLAERLPGYGFERHKGYPTADHRRAIDVLGPSPIHRLSFRLTPSASA